MASVLCALGELLADLRVTQIQPLGGQLGDIDTAALVDDLADLAANPVAELEQLDGVDRVRDALEGKFSGFVGSSGTGKSTILNALVPSLKLRTGEVSTSSRKGRHTTSYVQMFDTDLGTRVADTPGMREAGLWGVPTESIDYYFVEMRQFLGQCQFGDCWHFQEPDRAIRAAVAKGAISTERYESYKKLCQEVPLDEYETPRRRRGGR